MSIAVLPNLVSIIESFDVPLPLATRIFLAVSKFLVNDALVLVPGGIAVLAVLGFLLKRPRVRPVAHAVLLRIPLFGPVVKMVNLARMDRAFGSLIQSGIPIVEALAIVQGILGNVRYQQALAEATVNIRKGVSFGKSLLKYPSLFPPIEVDMITIGEETGKLDDVLLYLATFYEGIVDHRTKNLAQTIEPLLLLVVGVIVGVVVLAVVAPIYQITQAIS